MNTETLKISLIQQILQINSLQILQKYALLLQEAEVKQVQEAKRKDFLNAFGSWQSDLTADEQIAEIEASRYFENRTIEL